MGPQIDQLGQGVHKGAREEETVSGNDLKKMDRHPLTEVVGNRFYNVNFRVVQNDVKP